MCKLIKKLLNKLFCLNEQMLDLSITIDNYVKFEDYQALRENFDKERFTNAKLKQDLLEALETIKNYKEFTAELENQVSQRLIQCKQQQESYKKDFWSVVWVSVVTSFAVFVLVFKLFGVI